MKRNLMILALLCLTFIVAGVVSVNAQSIKPYLAIIKTNDHFRYKGILHKVDSNEVFINSDKGLEQIPFQSISSIKMRVPKKGYKAKDYAPITDKKTEYKLNSEGKFVDHWGNEESPLQEDIVASVVGNVFANSIGLSIHQINPGIKMFKINGDRANYLKQLEELSYYSIYYQRHPDLSAELNKLKEISSGFKQ